MSKTTKKKAHKGKKIDNPKKTRKKAEFLTLEWIQQLENYLRLGNNGSVRMTVFSDKSGRVIVEKNGVDCVQIVDSKIVNSVNEFEDEDFAKVINGVRNFLIK